MSCPIDPVEVVAYDPKVVKGDVCKVGATGTIAHCPDSLRGCLKPFIHSDIAVAIDFDACLV
jgi:hypothetical protein